jgi:hypothetical protein
LFAPFARRLGWRPEFKWARIAQWAERRGGVRVLERRAVAPLGQFSLIRLGRIPEPGQYVPRGGGVSTVIPADDHPHHRPAAGTEREIRC